MIVSPNDESLLNGTSTGATSPWVIAIKCVIIACTSTGIG